MVESESLMVQNVNLLFYSEVHRHHRGTQLPPPLRQLAGGDQVVDWLAGGDQVGDQLAGGDQVGDHLTGGDQVDAQLAGGDQVGDQLVGGDQVDAQLAGGDQEIISWQKEIRQVINM